MKFTQISVLLATAAAPQASALKLFRNKKADDAAADAQHQRQLADRWYAVRSPAGYDYGWCNSPVPAGYTETTYATDLACCQGAFPDQQSGYCLQWLQNPPTAAPTPTGGPDAWYKDNSVDASKGVCINTAPTPKDSSVKIYDTQAECCIAEYSFQADGYCLSQMVSPPTAAPTTLADKKWFKDPEADDFTTGTCINDGPVPSGYVAYDTNAECCAGEYKTQTSGACYAGMANAPSAAPSAVADIKYYPDYDTAYEDATCLPGKMDGRPSFDSMAECCIGAYPAQTSGACFAGMDSPPTVAPTTLADKKWFKDPEANDFAKGTCINDGPVPSGYKAYDTNAECCAGEYSTQITGACFAGMANAPSAAPSSVDDIKYYPDYDTDYEDATCLPGTMDGRPSFSSMAACCIGSYPDQTSGACFAGMANAPSAAPSAVTDIKYYPDYDTDYEEATCLPGTMDGRPSFSSMAACCIGSYPDQTSGACFAGMANAPSAAPSALSDVKWYPDYDTPYDEATCLSGGNPNGRPTYATQGECCIKAYPDQTTGACFAGMATAPSAAPSSVDDIKWFPDWSKAWTDGVCISGAAPPSGYTFASQAECCLNAYAGQSSGACLANMASPPTAAPFTVSDLVFYPIYTGDWSTGYCDNDPDKAPTVGTLGVSIFTTQAECCDLYFPNQPGRFCKTRVPFEGTLAPTPAPIYFYPKWGSSVDEGRCLNDGMEPAGITLYLDGKECCESEFPQADGSSSIGGCLLALGYTNAPTAAPTPKPTHKPVPDLP